MSSVNGVLKSGFINIGKKVFTFPLQAYVYVQSWEQQNETKKKETKRKLETRKCIHQQPYRRHCNIAPTS